MKKVYEQPKWIVWQLETENLEALTGSSDTKFPGEDLFDPLDQSN